MRCKNIFILVFGVFLLGAISASFEFNENASSIVTNYEMGDYLQAGINISFFNESLNSTFQDSVGNFINLSTLLERNPEYSYIFYDFSNTTISSAFQYLDLREANFIMPSQIKNFTYILNIGGINIFGKTFHIMSNKNLAQENINKKYSELNDTKAEIAGYDLSIQKILNDYLNITSIENNINLIKTEYSNATTSTEYMNILNDTSKIKIPKDISETINTNPISFYPSRENINLDVLGTIGGGDYNGNTEEYKDAIYSWNVENLKTTVIFKEIVINYDLNEQTVLRIFEFEFDKSKMSKDAYFIIQNIENLKFEDLSSQIGKTSNGYEYISLNTLSNKIVFSTTSYVNFLNVPVFISPSLNDLTPATVGPYDPFKDNKKSKWILFVIIVFIVLLIGVVAYVMLQIWYRRRYENYLFKNRNNLYNIMTFIQNAKKKGMERGEILKELKKANWTSEQINYAIKKYEGKKIAGIIGSSINKNPQESEKKPLETQKNPFENNKKPTTFGSTKV